MWPHKTLDKRCSRWSQAGSFDHVSVNPTTEMVTTDATHLRAHRIAASPPKAAARHSGQAKGGLHSKPHAVCDTLSAASSDGRGAEGRSNVMPSDARSAI